MKAENLEHIAPIVEEKQTNEKHHAHTPLNCTFPIIIVT